MHQYTLVSEPTRLQDLQPGYSGWIRRRVVLFGPELQGQDRLAWGEPDELVWPAMCSPLPDDDRLWQDPLDRVRGQIERSAFVFRSDRGYELVYPEDKNAQFMVRDLPVAPCITLFGVLGDTSVCPGAQPPDD